jgi:hypothetical protein
MDDDTFIMTFPSSFHFRLKISCSRSFDYTCLWRYRPDLNLLKAQSG